MRTSLPPGGERNRLKRKLERGELGLVAGNYESTDMVDFVGSLGLFDAVWIDMEHSPVTWSSLADLSRAADLWGLSSMVRVRSLDPALISLVLGEGIDGVFVPHVKTRSDAEQAVDAARYPPAGRRSRHLGRKSYGQQDDYLSRGQDDCVVIVMIEEVDGIENLPEILSVPGIDAFYISHHDLAKSMGELPGPDNPLTMADAHLHQNVKVRHTFEGAVRQVITARKVAAATVSASELEKYLSMGVRCVKVPQWKSWIATGAAAFAENVRQAQERAGTAVSSSRPVV